MLEDFGHGEERYVGIGSGPDHRLEPVAQRAPVMAKAEAVSFALSLRESRRVESTASFHDAIHVERYSRLLPTWSLSAGLPDEVVLGDA